MTQTNCFEGLPHRRVGYAVSDSTVAAAKAVVDYFNTHACTKDPYIPVVVAFEKAWNADNPGNTLGVDGQYGPLVQGAIQNVLQTSDVPPNCFGGPVAPLPAPPAPAPVNPPIVVNPPSPTPAPASSSNPWPYIIGATVVAGALAAYTYSRSKKKSHGVH